MTNNDVIITVNLLHITLYQRKLLYLIDYKGGLSVYFKKDRYFVIVQLAEAIHNLKLGKAPEHDNITTDQLNF